MILPIQHVIPDTLLRRLLKATHNEHLFRDGARTAGWYARSRKQNLQAEGKTLQNTLSAVARHVLTHEVVQAAARPASIVRQVVSRYDEGMHYDTHVDDALMDGQRTDLSFTLFLSDPEHYEGGELIIEETDGEKTFRLAPGDLLLYPSTTLHRVAPVIAGQRLAIVGWIRSHVRDAAAREILFDLDRSIHRLRRDDGDAAAEALPLLLKSRSNLLRRWAENQ